MASSSLVTSPLMFCGIVLANLLIVVVVANIRREDPLARAMIWPTATLGLAVVARTVMRGTTDPHEVMMAGRVSYMAALLMVPALLRSVAPSAHRTPSLVVTLGVAGAVFVDPWLFEGTVIALEDLLGYPVLAPKLAPWSWWLVPYAVFAFVAIAIGARRRGPEELSWVSTVVFTAAVMGVTNVAVLAADHGLTRQWGLEIVAAAAATTLLAHHMLSRTALQVEQLVEATSRVEAQRRAGTDHARRIARVSALGDAAGQLVARLERPARQLEDEVSVARGEITQACDVGQCEAEAMHAIIDAGAAARKLLRTIRRVRAFASPEADASERCDVAVSLRRAISMVDHIARHQTVIRLTTREEMPVIANRDQLTQLFVVLLRAMMRVATKRATTHPLTVRVSTDDGRILVRITTASR
ncbi:MAG: hypothetical protein RIF41_39100, partial [Polyangiaceae bacterium]